MKQSIADGVTRTLAAMIEVDGNGNFVALLDEFENEIPVALWAANGINLTRPDGSETAVVTLDANGTQQLTEFDTRVTAVETGKADSVHPHDAATTTTAGFMSPADKTKLDAINQAATQNAPDAQLRDRSTHTGEQAISTITGLQAALDAKASSGHSHSSASGASAGFMSAADKGKLDGIEAGATANATNAQLRDRSTHTGTQAMSTVSGLQSALDAKADSGHSHADVTNSASGLMTPALKTKLDGIAAGATVNATDASLRDRGTHTGSQGISTITGLQSALDAKAGLAGAAFTGAVTVPTMDAADNSANAASTAYVKAALSAAGAGTVTVSDATPAALGVAQPGLSVQAARADHVHTMPSAAQVGADPAGSAAAVNTTLATHTGNTSVHMSGADRAKLDAIEAGATADQTPIEIRNALASLAGDDRLDAAAIKNLPTGSGDGAGLGSSTPEPLGVVAQVGSSNLASRQDHIHLLPTAAQVGADPAGSAQAVRDELGAHAATNAHLTEAQRTTLTNLPDEVALRATYTYVDAELDKKANLTGAIFLGPVSGETAPAGDDSTKFATTAFVKSAIAELLSRMASAETAIAQNATKVADHESRLRTLEGASAPPPPPPPPTEAPAFDITPAFTADEGTTVTLSATNAADPDGGTTAFTYLWVRVSGPAVTIQNATSATCSITLPAVTSDQPLVVQCTVTDNDGESTSKTTTVTINNIDTSPYETTFDAEYVNGWAPTALPGLTGAPTRPVQAAPAKSASITTGGYTDATYNTKVRKITDVVDVGGGETFIRHAYSKQQVFNCDDTRFLAKRGSRWHLYDANTLTKLTGGDSTFQGAIVWATAAAPGGVAGFGEPDPIWHPTDPLKCWFTDDRGGLIWYEMTFNANSATGTITQLFDATAQIQAVFGSTATKLYMRGNGRTSDDGRYFAFLVRNASDVDLGFCIWDRSINEVVNYATVGAGITGSNIGISHDGTYLVYGCGGAMASSVTEAANGGPGTYGGLYVYKRRSTGSKVWTSSDRLCVSVTNENFDIGTTAQGQPACVFHNSTTAAANGFTNDALGSIAVVLLVNPHAASNRYFYPSLNTNSGVANSQGISISCSNSGFRKGWFVFSNWYGGEASGRGVHAIIGAGEIYSGSPSLFALGWHYTSQPGDGVSTAVDEYWRQPHAAVNRDMTRVVFASSHGAREQAEDYCLCLPSWAFPAARDWQNVAPAPNLAPSFTMPANFTMNEGTTTVRSITDAVDPEGKTLTYLWTHASGTAVTLSGTNTNSVTITAPSVTGNQTSTIECTVTDADGMWTRKSMTITLVDTSTQSASIETTFNNDSAYASYTPYTSSAALSRPSVSAPAKSASITSGGYIDPTFGTRIRKVVSASEGRGSGFDLRHSYSKQRVWNANNTRFLTRSGGAWYIYDANTLTRLNGAHPNGSTRVHWAHPDYGTNGVVGAGGVDACWDTTNPNVCYYGGDNEEAPHSRKWMKRTFNADGSGSSVLFKDFGPFCDATFGTGTYPVTCVSMHGDGRPSDDCRYWAFIAKNRKDQFGTRSGGDDNYQWCRGFFIWDAVEDKFCGHYVVPNGDVRWFDGINIAWDGSWMTVGHVGDNDYYTEASSRAQALANFPAEGLGQGIFAFKRRDEGGPFLMSEAFCITTNPSHSDIVKLANGKPAKLWHNYDGNHSSPDWPANWAGAPMCMVIDDNKGVGVGTNVWGYPGMTTYGGSRGSSSHFSGMALKRPGWAVFNYHDRNGSLSSNPYAGQVGLIELKPTNPRIIRLMWHFNGPSSYTGSGDEGYWGEPHAAPNFDLTRIMVATIHSDGGVVEDHCICLSSTAVPTTTFG